MTTDPRITALVTWAVSHGAVLHPSVQVYHDAATGFSFQVKPTAPGPLPGDFTSPVVRLPASLSLSYLNSISPETPANPGVPLSAALRAGTDTTGVPPPHVIGRLFFIKEYLAGESSFWHPYIQALPQPGDRASWLLPPFWDKDDAELLEGTNAEHGLARIRADLRSDLTTITAILRSVASSSLAAEDETNRRLVELFRPELYHWAYAIFSSRSFRPSLVLSDEQCRMLPPGVSTDDFSVLLPLFDMGNHDMTAPIRWQRCGGIANGGDERVPSGCELLVGRPYQPGEQVFNNYSLKTNAELLLGYGFMIAPTAALHNDYIHVRKRAAGGGEAPASEEYLVSARPLRDQSSVLARAKLPAVAGFDVEYAQDVSPAFQHVQPDMVWDIFTSIAPDEARRQLIPVGEELSVADAERQRRLLFLAGKIPGECLPYYAQTAAVIQHKVMQELERLNETDVEVDDADRESLTPYQKLALEYRDRCRVVLESTLEMMNNDRTLASAMEVMDEEE